MKFNKQKILVMIIIISIILLLITKDSLWLLNNLFYIGLSSFIVGGFLLIIHKGVFNHMFRSFKRFYQRTSKLEAYVSKKTPNVATQSTDSKKGYQFVKWLLGFGIILIVITTISAILFHS